METAPETPWKFHTTIPSDPALGSELINELLSAMTERDWPAQELFRVQLAYEEAIVNAIRHGNKCDADKHVEVEMSCDTETVSIRIADQGQGFDPKTIPDPREEDLLEVPGGRGVLLISEIMSKVTYNECGNEVTMVKHKGDPAAQDEDS